MALIQTDLEIEYPDSDGESMGESDWHTDWTIRLRELLKHRYRDRAVYVGSDLIVYYEKGNPRRSVVPDGFVVVDHPTHRRRIFKTWDEGGRVPDVAFEFTSLSSEKKDTIEKPGVYAKLGVKEYFVYDPEREYLSPPLRGFRLDGHRYVAIEPDASQSLHCLALGLSLRLQDDELLISDLVTGKPLLTSAEAAAERAEAEAESRRLTEAENARLRAELNWLRGQTQRARHPTNVASTTSVGVQRR